MAARRGVAVVGVILVAAAAGYGIYHWQAGPANARAAAAQTDAPRARAIPVITAAVQRQTVPLEINAIGQVTPWHAVSVKSRIDGQIMAVNFRPGDEVKAGQVLFKLDDRQLNAQLAQAEATLARDRATLASSRREAERQTNLGAREYATQKNVDIAKTQVQVGESTVQADLANIENLKVQLTYTTIKAPIDGRAGDVLLNSGNTVKANDTAAMVTINQLRPIAVQFAIPQRYFALVRQVMAAGKAEAVAQPQEGSGKAATGRITFLDNAIDAATGTFQVKAEFENADNALWPGMFVAVTIRMGADDDALVVPNAAVMMGQQGQYAYVLRNDNTVEARPLQVSRATSTMSVIEKGLQMGEQVVVEGQLRITNGSRVEIAKPEAAVAGEARGGQTAARSGSRRGASE